MSPVPGLSLPKLVGPWLHQHARARLVGAQALRSGAFAGELEALRRLPAPMPAAHSGGEVVVALLAGVRAAR